MTFGVDCKSRVFRESLVAFRRMKYKVIGDSLVANVDPGQIEEVCPYCR